MDIQTMSSEKDCARVVEEATEANYTVTQFQTKVNNNISPPPPQSSRTIGFRNAKDETIISQILLSTLETRNIWYKTFYSSASTGTLLQLSPDEHHLQVVFNSRH